VWVVGIWGGMLDGAVGAAGGVAVGVEGWLVVEYWGDVSLQWLGAYQLEGRESGVLGVRLRPARA
jgi:hypothetical protein